MIKHITEHEWHTQYEHEVLNCNRPAVLIFGAEWCSGCHNLMDNMSDLKDSNIDILSLDVDECDSLSDELNITSLPTVVVYENGEVSNVFENNVSSQEIIEYIQGMRE